MEKIMLLVVENRDFILTEYAKFLVNVAWNKYVSGISYWHEPYRRQIWYMRHEMIKKALEKPDLTHVLFVDTDVIPPDNFIQRLLAHDKAMVSGYYVDTTGKPATSKNGSAFIGKGLMEADVLSMGLSLIRRDVLEAVEYPAPKQPYKLDGDWEFCINAKEKGFQPYVDFTLKGDQLLIAPF